MSVGVSSTSTDGYECLTGGGEMGALMRSLDWSQTLLGPVETWPQSLRTSISTCLNSRFPILIWWGPDLVMLYNDAYRDIIAEKHPAALGHPGKDGWPEIWHIIGPMLEGVMQRAEATWSSDILLMLERNGYPEECYFTFSYSPIRDESGGVGGVFTPVAETTERVIGERRLRTLRDLAIRASGARDVQSACAAITQTISENPYSPFAVLYLFDDDPATATLMSSCGVEADSSAAPRKVRIAELPAPLRAAVAAPHLTAVEDLAGVVGLLPSEPWGIPPSSGVVLPILMPSQSTPSGFVLAGVNPRKRLDVPFRTFFELVGGHISAAIANARGNEHEHRRARALDELDRAKTVFFSNISHELRTPLTLILGPLEGMLARATPVASIGREEMAIVHRNAMRLSKLVNALLDFSRIEAGRVEARYEATDLGAYTAEIASAFESAVQQAGIKYVVDCPRMADSAYVDKEMWEKIVLNLISNAFKFTLEGRISVRLVRIGDQFELSVSDTGSGISADQLPRIFDRFHRVEGTVGRTGEGSGIGLALVQQLTKLHGGSVRVESSPGRGATFIVTIPVGQAHLPLERVNRTRVVGSFGGTASAYVDEALQWLPEASRPGARAHVFAADTVHAPHTQTATGRLLLADDNADMRAYVKRLLGDHYEVHAFDNGSNAIAAARLNPPDLVLTDVMMPGIDGFELLRRLRADPATSTVPVILLSARAGEDARVEGLRAGADDYIVKPFTARELLARVGAHLSMSKLRREAGERERLLREDAEAAHQRVATILESISDAFIALDPEWRVTYVNAEVERTSGISRSELIGRLFWEVFPDARGTDVYARMVQAMTERVSMRFEHFYAPWQRWFENRVYPAKGGGLSVFYQDITERKQAEAAVRKTNEAMRRANEDLERFAYCAKIDLREPLRTVRSYCQLLYRRYAGSLDADAKEMIAYCLSSAQRMDSRLIDLLEYVHVAIPTGSEEVGEDTALDSALNVVLGNLRTTIKEMGAIVTFDSLPTVRIAAVHAEQLFQNLIGNALKYRGEAAPRVHVSARNDGEFYIISVEDNGVGIAREYQEQVFAVFKRLHAASEYSGSGVRLAICKKVVERYGGNLWVESEVGKGSVFFFSIPKGAVVATNAVQRG